MKCGVVVVVVTWLLIGSSVSAQAQTVLTGTSIPDAAAWRIWLSQKGEPAGSHSETFTTYLASLWMSPADTATLQSALESFSTQETSLRAASNAKIDLADENSDATTAANVQTAFQTKLAALVATTQSQLMVRLSTDGAASLGKFLQGEKMHMTISPLDVTLAHNSQVIKAEPAGYHSHGSPQGTQMGYGYSTYGSMWVSVTGTNSSGEPYGTFYTQIGAQCTTSPCTGQCLTAYHSVVTEYNHAGQGTQVYTVAHQHPNTGMNGSYTYEWPFDASTNFYWPTETSWVYVQCTIAGIFLQNNPIGGGSPFMSELARTYTTTPGQTVYTCSSQPYCPVAIVPPSIYCSNSADYTPPGAQFNVAYDQMYMEFRQYGACERVVKPGPWTCTPQYRSDQLYSSYLVPAAGGGPCSHHP